MKRWIGFVVPLCVLCLLCLLAGACGLATIGHRAAPSWGWRAQALWREATCLVRPDGSALTTIEPDAIRRAVTNGADPNGCLDGGWTPLTQATANGDTERLSALLEAGADVDLRSFDWFWGGGNTPLAHAADASDVGAIRLLLAAGADLEAGNDCDRTPLLLTVVRGDLPTVKLLLDAGANVHAQTCFGDGVLFQALPLKGDATDLFRTLVDAGAPSVTNRRGARELHWAAARDQVGTVQQLLRITPVDARDDCEGTPLLNAALAGADRTVCALLSAGADADVIDCQGRSPKGSAHRETAGLLQDPSRCP